MAAITWQNVNGPSLAEAAQPLAYAGRLFDNAFGGLKDSLKAEQDMQKANWENQKANNTAAFMAALRNPQNATEFAQQRGALQDQLSGYSAQVDQVAAGNALDARKGVLEQRDLTEQQYIDSQTAVKDRLPSAMFTTALLNAKTKAEAEAIKTGAQAAFANGSISPMAATQLLQQGVNREDALVTQSRASAIEADRLLNAPLQRSHLIAQTNELNARAEKERLAKLAGGNEKLGSSVVSTLLDNHIKGQQNYIKGTSAIAQEFKIPVNAQGIPVIGDNVDPKTVEAFQTAIQKRLGLQPSASATLDTARTAIAALKLPIDQHDRLLGLLDKQLTSGATQAMTDGKRLDALKERQKVARDSELANNVWAVDPDNAKELTKRTSVIKQGDGVTDYTFVDIPSNLSQYMTKGFEYKNAATNKIETVKIPPRVLEQAIAQAGGIDKDRPFYMPNRSLTRVEDQLTAILNDPTTQELRNRADELKSGSSNNAKGELVDALRMRPDVPAATNDVDAAIKAYWDKRGTPASPK